MNSVQNNVVLEILTTFQSVKPFLQKFLRLCVPQLRIIHKTTQQKVPKDKPFLLVFDPCNHFDLFQVINAYINKFNS